MRSKKIPIKNRQRFFYFLYTLLQAVASTNVATKNKKKQRKNFERGALDFILNYGNRFTIRRLLTTNESDTKQKY
jgi:hypothetical protein